MYFLNKIQVRRNILRNFAGVIFCLLILASWIGLLADSDLQFKETEDQVPSDKHVEQTFPVMMAIYTALHL